jgi:hypothetical protein
MSEEKGRTIHRGAGCPASIVTDALTGQSDKMSAMRWRKNVHDALSVRRISKHASTRSAIVG